MDDKEYINNASEAYKKMLEALDANYTHVVSYHLNDDKEIMLGDSSATRTCRFCGRSEPEVTFKKVAHAIPHFIGNRTLKSLYECDECNGKVFSSMESHFSRFMGIYHTFNRVSKSEKVPTYRNNSTEKSKIVVDGRQIKIDCVEGEELTPVFDKKNKTVTIKAKRSYVPQDVYKIFIKMALTIMPESEMSHFKNTLEWLMGKRELSNNLKLIELRYNGLQNPFDFVSCMVFKRKPDHRDNVPSYIFGLAYFNFFFQTYIPLCDEDKTLDGDVSIPYIPTPLDYDGLKYQKFHHDLSSTMKVCKEDVSQPFKYESMEERNFRKEKYMFALKYIFDRVIAFIGLFFLWPVLLIVAILVKIKMPGSPAFFVQKRVGKDGRLFDCHKFRTMRVAPEPPKGERKENSWSTVSVAGDSRITPLGAKLRHYKLDELPGLWDVLIGNMSFVGPRPDVPGYADNLEGADRDVLKLRPGITGPATLKYRLEDEMISEYVAQKQKDGDTRNAQDIAVEYNDNVIYPDKVRLNSYYYHHYSFFKDIQMILCTVLGKKMEYAGQVI